MPTNHTTPHDYSDREREIWRRGKHSFSPSLSKLLQLPTFPYFSFAFTILSELKALWHSAIIAGGHVTPVTPAPDARIVSEMERYDIPGEIFITNFISAQVRKHKNSILLSREAVNGAANREPGQGSDSAARTRRVMPALYSEKFAELLHSNALFMPRHARAALISTLALEETALPDDFPIEQAVKNKVSSMRAALRRCEAQS